MYKNLPESEEPKWSTGWLSRFKQRYGIRQFIQHGEAASAPGNVEVEESMRVIQDILMYKEQHEIYNMDETALFWRMTPDSSLTTEQLSGFKKDKNSMTAALCSNADASDKCSPWFIGKSQNPRAFTNINRNTLGCHYRANKTACMTTVIMKAWLLWFNNRMSARRRNVILLLDNFSAHNCAVEELEKEGHLTHVKVLFFLPGITSKHQPMDQGIIRAWKAYYRRHMLLYLTECLDKDSALIEPHKYINLLHAISWATEAWREGVKETTIQNCFLKAKVKVHGPGILDPNNLRLHYPDTCREVRMEMNRLEDELEAVSGALGIHNPLLIEQLLDHADELVQDEELNEQEIEDSIIQQYYQAEEQVEEELEDIPVEVISHKEAMVALERLHLYEMQQEDGVAGAEWVRREKKSVIQRELLENGRKKERNIEGYFRKV